MMHPQHLKHQHLLTSIVIFFMALLSNNSGNEPGNHAAVEAFTSSHPPTAHRSQQASQQHSHASTSTTDSNVDSNINNTVDDKMTLTYDSLATRLINRYNQDFESNALKNNQLFVCIAGGPGSGKSTLAAAVANRINDQKVKLMQQPPPLSRGNKNDNLDGNNTNNKPPAAVVLPMDGYHYSRQQLQEMGNDSSPEMIHYTYESLLARRGAPWTFDAQGCIADFTSARINGYANLPIYCRIKSDPVPNGVTLHATTNIFLLEGNYLLAWEDERWSLLQSNEVFDETWYIACKSLEEQRERLVKRHLETWSEEKTRMWGEGRLGAGAKADANDMLNARWIDEMSRKYADLVIESV